MTEHEKEALKRKAAKNGMTVSEYARTLLANSDDATIRVIDTEPLRKAAHELAKQGTNLNQFMKFLNTYGGRYSMREKHSASSRVRWRRLWRSRKPLLPSEGKQTATTSKSESTISITLKTNDEGKERVDGQVSPSTLNQVWSSVSTVASIPPSVNESA